MELLIWKIGHGYSRRKSKTFPHLPYFIQISIKNELAFQNSRQIQGSTYLIVGLGNLSLEEEKKIFRFFWHWTLRVAFLKMGYKFVPGFQKHLPAYQIGPSDTDKIILIKIEIKSIIIPINIFKVRKATRNPLNF